MNLTRRNFGRGAAALAALSAFGVPASVRAQGRNGLNILCWEGYNTDDVLSPFRAMHPGAEIRAESGTSTQT